MKICLQCHKEYPADFNACPDDGTMLQQEDELIGKTIGSRYEVVDKIGEGGMGTVYKVRQIYLDQFLALKVMRPELLAADREFLSGWM